MTNQVNQAFEKWYQSKIDEANENNDMDMRHEFHRNKERYKYGWQAATQASDSEINSLKQRVVELDAENTIMRDALNKIALGYVLDADIIESAGDCLQRLSTTKSLAEHDNATIERIATALENAEGELKYLPEYVSLVRGMKLTP